MKPALMQHIESLLGTPILRKAAVSGGDISGAYALETGKGNYFCKLNSLPQGIQMFRAEQEGLEAIAATETIKTPEVIATGRQDGEAFLLMAFIESKRPDPGDMAAFGSHLAAFHQAASSPFGWHQDNYIGSLPQSNSTAGTWPSFYAGERLLPQFKLAFDRQMLEKRDIPDEGKLEAVVCGLCGEVRPSLLHGDLWGGNYLISASGAAYLIDPAVYVGHNEVDLAMTRLFGGFPAAFYDAYENLNPPSPGAGERQGLYQLYYLLVHLNLFGNSYRSSVLGLTARYFR